MLDRQMSSAQQTIEQAISEMTRRIVERFDPLQVILFGSQARGDAHADSDVDLLVVMPSIDDTRGAAIAIRRLLRGSGVAKDIVVTTPDEIAARGRLVGTVLESALRDGRVLYERRPAA